MPPTDVASNTASALDHVNFGMPTRVEMTVPELVRAIEVNRNAPHLWFLGAGASISSGVPSAGDCIWKWKRSIFLSSNPGIEDLFSELSLPSTRDRIQRWLDSQRVYPHPDSSDEYGVYAEKCYPLAADRQQFFKQLIAGKEPHVGYQLLALLAEGGLVDSVWTTNFDGLAARAAIKVSQLTPLEIGLDSTARLRPPQRGEFQVIALHGDYRYDSLKNLPDEIAAQEVAFASTLAKRIGERDLVVLGYSGRDDSIMTVLRNGFAHAGQTRLYWCHAGSHEPSTSVVQLLEAASSSGHPAFLIRIAGFDDLLFRLGRTCLSSALSTRAASICDALADPNPAPAPFAVADGSVAAVAKSNAFPVVIPSEIFQGHVDGFDCQGAWRKLRNDIGEKPIVAGLLRGKVLAFGALNDLRDTFSSRIRSPFARTPIQSSARAKTRHVSDRS